MRRRIWPEGTCRTASSQGAWGGFLSDAADTILGLPWQPLTARGVDVLRLVAHGATNRGIAERLFLPSEARPSGQPTVTPVMTSVTSSGRSALQRPRPAALASSPGHRRHQRRAGEEWT